MMKNKNRKSLVKNMFEIDIPPLFKYIPKYSRDPYDETWLEKKGYVSRLKNGSCSFSYQLLELINKFDNIILKLFKGYHFIEVSLPVEYSLNKLALLGYSEKSLFCVGNTKFHFTPDKERLAVIPAVCLPLYEFVNNNSYKFPAIFSIRNKVSRREEKYDSFFTLKEFEQREFVVFGTKEYVESFLQESCELLKKFVQILGVGASLNISSDVFYENNDPAVKLYQIASKSKIELRAYISTSKHGIPLSSCNNHRMYFSKIFNMKNNDKLIHSGCVSFGLQRWVFTMLLLHGFDGASIILDGMHSD